MSDFAVSLPSVQEIPAGHCRAYYELPEVIQFSVTYDQWLWLSDAEKSQLTLTLTEPEDYRT